MKIKHLFLSGLTCCTFAACSNSDEPTVTEQELSGDQYIALNIVTANENNSRALTGSDFQDGTTDENTVSSAFVCFFRDGNYHSSKTVSLTWEGSTSSTNPAVEKQSDAVIVLEKPTSLPNQMVVILNAPTELTQDFNLSLAALKAKAGDYSACTSGAFIMSNSVWGDNCEVAITASDLYTTPELAKQSPVNVYVERVVARIDVTQNSGSGITVDPIKGEGANNLTVTDYTSGDNATEETKTITTEITGYHIAGANKYSYILKNLPTDSDTYWKGTDKGWNDSNNKRSYWAKSYNGTENPKQEGVYYTYSGSTPTSTGIAKTFYCQEKTDGQTYLVITAQHKLGGEAKSFIKYLTLYYTENGFKKTIAQDLVTKGYTFSKTVEGNTTTSNDWYTYLTISRSSSVTDNTGKWRIEVTLDETTLNKAGWAIEDDTKTNVNTVLATYKDAWEWKNGKAYYYVPIEHINSTESNKEYAVVRNHLYSLNITSISGLGTPIYEPGEEEEEIIPEKPTDADSYVAAQINVLKWRLVKQQNVTID